MNRLHLDSVVGRQSQIVHRRPEALPTDVASLIRPIFTIVRHYLLRQCSDNEYKYKYDLGNQLLSIVTRFYLVLL